MIMYRFDRYLLREMIGPFVVSVCGLLLFILLNLILSLSGLMVDRGVSISVMVRLLIFKTPAMLVIALPVSGLFATFLGFGRLVHDREIMALEAAGISLRRILLPLVIAAFALGIGDFVLYNWAVPPAEHAYQTTLQAIILREGTPHIRANTFFKGPHGEFFYVRRYNEKDKTLHEVLVYDTQGKLFPAAKAAVTILTAQQGRWEGETWSLTDGRVYGYDSKGVLIYSGTFKKLEITAGSEGIGALFSSRTPAEMGISELRQRIKMLRRSGLSADELIVECNLKVAIPLATVVFVLFGGTMSLLFAWRSRAVGIVIGFLLVGLFQGTLLWTQTLGKRGILPPAMAAWIPDIAFGFVGLLLFLRLDRLHRGNLKHIVKRMLPFLMLLAFWMHAAGGTLPVAINCDKLFISADNKHVKASGSVHLAYEKISLYADRVSLDQNSDGEWALSADGRVSIKIGDELELHGKELTAKLSPHGNGLATEEATTTDFQGRSRFQNSKGEEHILIYRGKKGSIAFDENGDVSAIEISDGELSTCDCCSGVLHAQPYSIEMSRLIIYPDRLIVAFNLSVFSFGTPVFWLPVYVQPLKETMESPLFPAFGESALHGFFLKWNFPFYLDQNNYGTILFDYFSRFSEIGLGAVVHYAFAGLSGKARVYFFPARIGDSVTEISLSSSFALPIEGQVSGSMDYKAVGETHHLTFSFALNKKLKQWRLSVSASRSTTKNEGISRTVERLPEISLTRSGVPVSSFTLSTNLSAGWFKEWEDSSSATESVRIGGTLTAKPVQPLRIWSFTISPRATVEAARYASGEARESVSLVSDISAPQLQLTYTYRLVHGQSPFTFDKLKTTNHLTWSLGKSPLTLTGGFNINKNEFDLLKTRVSFPPFTLQLDYNLNTGRAEKVTFSGAWQENNTSVSFSFPYLPQVGKLGKASFAASARSSGSSLSLQGTFTPEYGLNCVFHTEIVTEEGWGIFLSGRYKSDGNALLSPGIGIFYEFYKCLRIGVEEKSGQTWLYASITAFPEAVLRYAPSGAGLKLGE